MKKLAIVLGLCGFSPLLSAAIIQYIAPVATMTIGGLPVTGLTPTLNQATGLYSFTGGSPGNPFASSTGWILNSISFDSFDDPYIDYGDSVTNTGATPLTVSFVINQAYVGGPYNTFTDSFSDNVTDSGNTPDGNVTISVPAGSTAISQPSLNGVNIDGISTGCVKTGGPGFSSGCTPAAASPNITTVIDPITGTFGIALNFTISPGDLYAFTGRVSLTNSSSVPEPSTIGFLTIGMVVIGGMLAFRRKRLNASI